MNLATSFYRHTRETPEATALFVEGRAHSYAALAKQVSLLAGWLQTRISDPHARVGILASRSLTTYTGILAAASAGHPFVPLNPKNPPTRLRETLQRANPAVIIADEESLPLLLNEELAEALPPLVIAPFTGRENYPSYSFDGREALTRTQPLANPVAVHAESLAYLMFTSGTTGTPKGIMVSVGNVAHLLSAMQQRYQIKPEDRLSHFFELTFDPTILDMFMTWNAGASLYVIPEEVRLTPLEFIRRHHLTIWHAVPSSITLLRQMRQLKPDTLPALRHSLFCGESLSTADAEAWKQTAPNSTVQNHYGPTEVTVDCLIQQYGSPESINPERNSVAIGRPVEGLHAAVLDSKLQFLPAGSIGELAINGPQVTPGYWENPEETSRRYLNLKHPKLGSSRWYLTGDRVYQNEDGIFHFLGRIDHQVKINGRRVELEEIDHHLQAVSGCVSAVAIMIYSDNAPAQLTGIIESTSVDPIEIKNALHDRIPGYMVPKKILTTTHLPRTLNGKVDRAALQKFIAQGIIG